MRRITEIRKNSLFLLLTGLLALVLLTGCGDDDDPTDPTGGGTNPGQATFTATIDGTVVDFSDNAAALLDDTRYTASGGDQVAGDVAVLNLPRTTGVVDFSLAYGITLTTSGTVYIQDQTALCTITTATTTSLVGTFSGTFVELMTGNTVSVTGGAFNLPVTDIR